MKPSSATYTGSFHYLPVEPDALNWGLHVIDFGAGDVTPGSPYPPVTHPESHMFNWDKGRVLDEFQMVYITRGRGTFECSLTGRIRIGAGHVILLFPGVWHRYRPVRSVGWDEHWIGFGGQHAQRIMERFFRPEQPVLQVGVDEELVRVMRSVGELLTDALAGYQQIMAARTLEALARARCLTLNYQPSDRRLAGMIHHARCYILDHAGADIDLKALAKNVGLSYSHFRTGFKKITGSSPRQYQLEIRLNKARTLLRDTTLTASEIGEIVGFSSLFYFSRRFKAHFGKSPQQWRRLSA